MIEKICIIIGTRPERILDCARSMMDRDLDWDNPFGDGVSGEKIRRVMTMSLGK